MALNPKKMSEFFNLTARIGSCNIAYHLAQGNDRGFNEALDLEMLATIEAIHPKFKRHQGKDLEISLTASGRTYREETGGRRDNAIYLLDLRADSRYLSGVIPSDAIWALPGLIDAGRIAYVVVDFEPPQRGKGKVISVDFLSQAGFSDY